MLGHLRRNAVAYVALFVALGGTSYAAAMLPRNSVGTSQLRDQAVTAAKVKSHSLTASDFKGSLAGERGPTGLQGEPGSKGDTGAAGLSTSLVQDDLAATTGPALSSALPIKNWTVNLSSAGKLAIVAPELESVSFDNPTGATISYSAVGLYLDGNPIAGGTVLCNCSVPPNNTAVAGPIVLPELSIPNVGAGSHTLTMALYSAGNTTNYVTSASTRIVVLATGS